MPPSSFFLALPGVLAPIGPALGEEPDSDDELRVMLMPLFSNCHRWPRAQRSASPPPPAGEATVLDGVMPFDYRLYRTGQDLGVPQLSYEPTQTYGERLAVITTERQFTVERLRVCLTSKE